MSINYVQSNTQYLAGSGVLVGAVNIVVTGFTDIYGNVLAMSDFGATGYITLEPDTTNEEAATFTTLTVNASGTVTLGGVSTLLAKSPYTATSGLVRAHSGGTKVVITDNVGFWNTFANTQNTEVITADWQVPTPVGASSIANKAYVDQTATGSATYDQNIIAGTAGVGGVTKGQVVYFNTAAGKWLVADSSAASTSVAVLLGIAQGTSASGVAVNVLLEGLDKTQTGLSVGAKYWLSTAGTISTTPGTFPRIIGRVPFGSTTSIIVETAGAGDQQIALADGSRTYIADTGTTNALVATLTTAIVTYNTGFVLSVLVANTNTAATTINVNGLGVKTIKKVNGVTDLAAGDIVVGQIISMEYDGTNFQLLTPPANLPQPQVALTAAESITAGAAVAAGYYQADAGVTFDAKAAANATASSISTSFTVGANSNRILVVTITLASGSVTAISYNSVAMTAGPSKTNIFNYYLVAPATGSNTLSISLSGSVAYAYSVHSYYNAKQTGQLDSNTNATVSNPALTFTITPVLDGSLVYAATNYSNGAGSQPTSGTGLNNNTSFSNSGASFATIYSGDMGVSVPAAAISVTLNGSGGSNQSTMNGIGLTIAPATAPTYSQAVNASSGNTTSYTHPTTTAFRYIAYLGIALNTASATQSISVQTAGVVSNQSGLKPLQQYYVNDTNGTIGTSAGTNTRKAGIAVSATQLDITNNW